jgi:HD superfamily phosphohydrolase
MIPPDWINLLRLAALCHDVGHGLMSHVSENALDSLGLIKDLELELEDHLDLEDCSLSEAAAYFMLGSPGFSELLALARTLTEHDLPRDTPRLLQKLVAGALVHPRFPLLQELISGPFDADKLDYMNRDACMTGVPVVTDIPRLIQKLRQVEVDAADLPADIAKNVRRQERKPSYFIQAVMLSGARTIDELMLGRTLLYDKVYRHQKVRAVEAMVAVVVAGLAKLARQPAMLPLLIEDRDLLELRRETLSEKLGAPISDGAWRELRGARAVADRLRQRALFVRAYAFSQTMPRDPFRADAMQTHALGQLQSDVEKPSARMELLRRIVEQLRRMRLSCHRISSDTQLR